MSTPALKLLWLNCGLDAIWSASSSVATLPARNLANAVRRKVCRSSGLENPWRLIADFGAAGPREPIAGIGFVGANWTTAATVLIKLNDADAWGAPAQTFALTVWNAANTGVLVRLFAAAYSYRYLAIEVTDLLNPDGYYELGVPVPSPVFDLPRGAPHEFMWGIVDPSQVSRAPDNTPLTEDRVVYAEADMAWHNLAESIVFGDLQTVLRTMGRKRDVVLSVFASDPDDDDVSRSLNLFGRFVDLPKFTYVDTSPGDDGPTTNKYDWGPLTFRESGAAAVPA